MPSRKPWSRCVSDPTPLKRHVRNLSGRLTGLLFDRFGQRLGGQHAAGVIIGGQERVEVVGVGARIDEDRFDPRFVNFVDRGVERIGAGRSEHEKIGLLGQRVLDQRDLALDVGLGIGPGELQPFEPELLLRRLAAGDTSLPIVGIYGLDDEHEAQIGQRFTGGEGGVCYQRAACCSERSECRAEAKKAGAVKSPVSIGHGCSPKNDGRENISPAKCVGEGKPLLRR